MLRYIAHLAIAAPRRIIAVAVLVMVGAAVFGIPGIKSLSAAGFQDPTAESARAAELLSAKFGRGDLQIIFMVTSENGAQSFAARAVGTDIVEQLRALARCRRGRLGLDRTTSRGRAADQQGRQVGARRRRHHRRGNRRAETRQGYGRAAGS